jgi:hypothetical protein
LEDSVYHQRVGGGVAKACTDKGEPDTNGLTRKKRVGRRDIECEVESLVELERCGYCSDGQISYVFEGYLNIWPTGVDGGERSPHVDDLNHLRISWDCRSGDRRRSGG